jgi:hypothetical protein
MNHPENITFILVIYYSAKKKVRKTKRNSDLGFIFADLYAILAHLCAILATLYANLQFALYVRFEFSATKAGALQKQIQIPKF